MSAPELTTAIAELQRELAMRRSVYPKQIQAGRLSAANADRQIKRMELAAQNLCDLRDLLTTTSLTSIRELVTRLQEENLALGKAAR